MLRTCEIDGLLQTGVNETSLILNTKQLATNNIKILCSVQEEIELFTSLLSCNLILVGWLVGWLSVVPWRQ